MTKTSGFSLYWIIADGAEDCFVVARNSRSALLLEANYSGFDPAELSAVRVKPIKPRQLSAWLKRRRSGSEAPNLPWYADRWLLTKLGARFRERGAIEETLIDSVVYSQGGEHPIDPRTIGTAFLAALERDKTLRYLPDDVFSQQELQLYTIVGVCLARCHEIEFLISHSFVLGGMSKRHREKNDTIGAVVAAWKRMTLGQMLRTSEEAWDIDPILHLALKEFAKMRNLLAHGLTLDEQYGIDDPWGRDELVRFLALFEIASRLMREVFRGSFYTSLTLSDKMSGSRTESPSFKPTRKENRQIGIFMHAMRPKGQ